MDKHALPLTSVGNARDLGGYPTMDGRIIKQGRILRTASLAKINEADQKCLLKDYHLSTIIDLRMDFEKVNTVDPEMDGVKHLDLKIIDEAAQMALFQESNYNPFDITSQENPLQLLYEVLTLGMKTGFLGERMYVDFVSNPTAKQSFGKLFEELLSLKEPQSLLFHCSQGKDRTGIAAMFILSCLGVEEEVILSDYLLTNLYNAKIIAYERAFLKSKGLEGEELERYIHGMDEVDETYMLVLLKWLKENYGSPVGYLKQEIGITDVQLQALKDLYLE